MPDVRSTALTVIALAALTACGGGAGADGPAATDRSLAAVTIDEIGLPVEYATHAYLTNDEADAGGEVRFAAADGVDPSLAPDLSTLVLPASAGYADRWCQDGNADGCVTDMLGDGRVSLVKWQLEEPEEDPGIVEVAVAGDDGIVKLNYHGDSITKDPREPGVMPDGLGVDELLALAASDRLGAHVTQADHDAGQDLSTWVEEEPDTSGF